MIGKFYRPLSIKNYVGKRGFLIHHKYKSHFGGVVEFIQGVYLDYDFESKSEEIRVEFLDFNAPVQFSQDSFIEKPAIEQDKTQNKIVISFSSEGTAPLKKKSVRIMHLRKLHKPSNIKTSNGEIELVFPIMSSSEQSEEDVLVLVYKNDVIDGKEVIIIKAICNTPVKIRGANVLTGTGSRGNA